MQKWGAGYYRRLIDGLPTPVWLCHADGTVFYFNARWNAYTGWPAEAHDGRDWLSAVHPEDCEALRPAWQRAVVSGDACAAEYRLRRHDGVYRWFDGHAAPVRDDRGVIGCWIGVSIEAEIQRRLHHRLQRHERQSERYARLLDLVPATSFELETGRITYWSRGAEAHYGYSGDEAMGREIRSLLDVRFPLRLREILDALTRRGEWAGELDIRCRDGTRRAVRSHWLLDAAGDGEPDTVLQMHTDVTDLKRAETAARQAETRLHDALTRGHAGTWAWHVQRDEVDWDESLFLLFGIPPPVPAVRGSLEHYLCLVHPDDRTLVRAAFARVVAEGGGMTIDFRLHAQPIRWLAAHGTATRDADGRVQIVDGVCFDVTDRRAAEDALRRSRAELRLYAQALDAAIEQERAHIAYELHDELGQRLTALKMDTRWLMGRLAAQGPPAPDYDRRATGMLDLIDDTIDKVRSLSLELRPHEIEMLGLRAAIERYLEQFQLRTGIACDSDLAAEPLVEREHKLAVFRVMQEAMTNVARHSAAGAVMVRLFRAPDAVVLEVSDDGKGFVPSDGSREGLGVIGMRERAAQLGGRVTIDGRGGRGTRVRLELPVARA